jgi:regulator of chromosome condensation
VSIAAGTDNTFAITNSGKAYAWGFSGTFQTGLGTDDDVEIPTHVDNTAVRGKKLLVASAGGQFSLLGARFEEPAVNGTAH